MINILGTACCNTKLLYILIKQVKLKLFSQQVKQGVFVLLNAVTTHPVKWIWMYVVGWLVADRSSYNTQRGSFSTAFHLSLKISAKTSSPPGSPSVPLWRDQPVSRPIFYIFLRVPNKNCLLMKQSYLSLEVPSEGAPSHPWSPNGAPMEWYALFPQPVV